MSRFEARLAYLESLVPTAMYAKIFFDILQEAARMVALADATTEALLTALRHYHEALKVPPLVDAEAFVRVGQALTDGALEAITTYVPPSQQVAFRKTAAELCYEEAARQDALAAEACDDDATL